MADAPTLDDGGGVGDLGAAGADEADVGGSSQVQLGIILTLAGTMFYALEYVLCERAFSVYDKPADAKQLCFWTGAWGLTFTAVWLVAVTIPQWSELVVAEVEAHDGRWDTRAQRRAAPRRRGAVESAPPAARTLPAPRAIARAHARARARQTVADRAPVRGAHAQ